MYITQFQIEPIKRTDGIALSFGIAQRQFPL